MRFFLTCLFVVVLCSASTARAQEVQVGLGVALEPSTLAELNELLSPASSLVSTILVPINVSGFRVEPSLGLYRLSRGSGDTKETLSAYEFGLGAFLRQPRGASTLYYGVRAGLLRTSTSQPQSFRDESESQSQMDVYVGPTVGGSYAFSPYFSLGAEVEVRYLSAGNLTYSNDDFEDVEQDASVIRTRPKLVGRFYF